MPTYRITDPATGRTIEIDAPNPPPERVVRQMFEQLYAQDAPTAPAVAQEPSQATPEGRSGVLGVATGIGKEALRRVTNLGNVAREYVPGVAQLDRLVPPVELPESAVTPTGGAERTGAFLEQLGEFAIPAGKIGLAGNMVKSGVTGAVQALTPDAEPSDVLTAGALSAAVPAVVHGVTSGVRAGARGLYRQFLKPSLAHKSIREARSIVDTAIREGLPMSPRGAGYDESKHLAGKAADLITNLRAEAVKQLAAHPHPTGRVDLKAVADGLRAWGRQKYFRPGVDLSDYEAVLKVADRIDAHPSLGIPPGVRPTAIRAGLPKAEEVKQALQASATYGVPNATAENAATQHGAFLARTALEGQAGGPQGAYALINAREAKLIPAAKAIAHAVEREANQYKMHGWKNVTSGLLAGGGIAAGQDPDDAALMALAFRAGLSPALMSRVAILADRLASSMGIGANIAGRLAVSLLLESQGDRAEPAPAPVTITRPEGVR